MQSIAKRYGVSVKQVMTFNSLKNSKVKIGQTLKVDTKTISTKQELNSRSKGTKSNSKVDTKKSSGKKANAKTTAKSKGSKKSCQAQKAKLIPRKQNATNNF